MKLLESVKTEFGTVSVQEDGNIMGMYVNGDCQGRLYAPTNTPASWYMTEIINIVSTRPVSSRVLVLGGGAFILPNYLYSVDFKSMCVIEQNPEVYLLAKKYFKIDQRIKVIINDASSVLGNIGKFDIVILDLFNGFDYCETVSFESIKKLCLAPNGIVLENRLKDGVRITIIHG